MFLRYCSKRTNIYVSLDGLGMLASSISHLRTTCFPVFQFYIQGCKIFCSKRWNSRHTRYQYTRCLEHTADAIKREQVLRFTGDALRNLEFFIRIVHDAAATTYVNLFSHCSRNDPVFLLLRESSGLANNFVYHLPREIFLFSNYLPAPSRYEYRSK